MKKFYTLGLLVLIILGMALPALAVDEDPCADAETVINGIVSYDPEGNDPAADVEVDVFCNGYDDSDMTDENGYYFVVFGPGECPLESYVEACVGDMCNDGIVTTCFDENPINILGIDIIIPEFGLIAGAVAAAGAIAGFVFLRKKH